MERVGGVGENRFKVAQWGIIARKSAEEIMRKIFFLFAILSLVITNEALADTIVLRDGTSYAGQCNLQTVTFTDAQGVNYVFPLKDVQSLAFNSSADTVALRGGKSYSGKFTGSNPVAFQDAQGVKYQFPTSDIEVIVFSHAGLNPPSASGSLVIPSGADLPVRTDEAIDSANSYTGQTYAATITEDILDIDGHVAIPSGSSAQLIIRKISSGGIIHSPELVLDLYSVTVDKKQYGVLSSAVTETNRKGLGANKRTGELVGGGTALGALVGGIFGGGKGAGIGALAGAGGGLVTQAFTRGKEVKVPVETVLRFRLEKTLVLQPAT
jgi:hypothetical protein